VLSRLLHQQTFVGLLLALLVWACAWRLRSTTRRQALLLAVSYVFYASWGPWFLAPLVTSSILNYWWGSVLRRRNTTGFLWIGIAINLLPLAFFKYVPHTIAMPIGMSFWTFQALSYLFDIYFGNDAEPSLLEFCLYIAFWPTVLSGPICRLPNMLPQFRATPVFSPANLSAGALLVIQGAAMKLVMAQLLGSGWKFGAGVNAGFALESGWGAADVWALGVGYGFQLFFDFAGYSLMAIGVARLFGIVVADNFDRPFLSPSPSVFWTRWHMSLSFWIRDYVFSPLASAWRGHAWWPYLALVISMVLFGIWHGPKLTFVVYGFYHGVLLVLHRLGQQAKDRLPFRLPPRAGFALACATTFLLMTVGFILFRVNDLSQAAAMLRVLVTPSAYRHFVLPRSFYALVVAVAAGYFANAALQPVLRSWRARYREAAGMLSWPSADAGVITVDGAALSVGRVADFFATRLWWWMVPGLSILAVLAGVAMNSRNSVITLTPFIYTLF
jgi:alginate O-acetyltransferase complex protein AlgI